MDENDKEGIVSTALVVSENKLKKETVIDHDNDSVPAGYLFCDGSAVSRTTYADLFATIGRPWRVFLSKIKKFF